MSKKSLPKHFLKTQCYWKLPQLLVDLITGESTVRRRWVGVGLDFESAKTATYSDHKELRSLVHSIKGSRETFLDDFLDVRKVHLYLEWDLQQYVLTGDSRWFLHYILMYRKQLSDFS
jgi:hypothetical protein